MCCPYAQTPSCVPLSQLLGHRPLLLLPSRRCSRRFEKTQSLTVSLEIGQEEAPTVPEAEMPAKAGQDRDNVLRETSGPQEEEQQVEVTSSEEAEVDEGDEPAGADGETISVDEDLDARDERPTTRAQKYIWQK